MIVLSLQICYSDMFGIFRDPLYHNLCSNISTILILTSNMLRVVIDASLLSNGPGVLLLLLSKGLNLSESEECFSSNKKMTRPNGIPRDHMILKSVSVSYQRVNLYCYDDK